MQLISSSHRIRVAHKKSPATRRVSLFFLLSLIAIPSASVEAADTKYMGVASCASSNCHGGTSPRKATSVLQNEYSTWFKHDAHAQAFAVLRNKDSKLIAKHLGIANAEKDALCLQCHATYVPKKDLHGDRFRVEDGVGCESCHGAAEKYLQPHTAKDNTHADNISNGLIDLVSLENRTKVCLECHHGTDDQTVNHRLIGAGHPRLTFELDTYALLQPNHWEVDEDYIKRKSSYNSAQAWAVGQTVRAIEMTKALSSKERSHFGAYPELSLLYCYTCHHSLTEEQWKTRSYGGRPGELQMNVSSILMVREALKVLQPSLGTELASHISKLEVALAKGGLADAAKSTQTFLQTKVLPAVSSGAYGKDLLNRLLKQVVTFAAQTPFPPYEVAEQGAMGVSAISAAIDPSGSTFQKRIDDIYGTLEKEKAFNPASYTASAQRFLGSLK